MSIQAIVAAWDAPIESPTQKSVLAVLGNYADQDNKCWPSLALVARMTSFSENTVRSALVGLEKDGWISREMRAAPNGRTTSSLYRLMHIGRSIADIAPGVGSNSRGVGGSNSKGGRVQLSGGGRVQELDPLNPYLEPTLEPVADARAREADSQAVEVDPMPSSRAQRQPWRNPDPDPATVPSGDAFGFGSQPAEPPPADPPPAPPTRAWMPRLNDPEHRWAHLAPDGECDPKSMNGSKIQYRGAWHLRLIADLVAQAMGISDMNFFTDWRPLCRWLDDGICPHDVIVPTVKRVMSRRSEAPGNLAYFDRAVREAAHPGRKFG